MAWMVVVDRSTAEWAGCKVCKTVTRPWDLGGVANDETASGKPGITISTLE
jgi:hypothetical protein